MTMYVSMRIARKADQFIVCNVLSQTEKQKKTEKQRWRNRNTIFEVSHLNARGSRHSDSPIVFYKRNVKAALEIEILRPNSSFNQRQNSHNGMSDDCTVKSCDTRYAPNVWQGDVECESCKSTQCRGELLWQTMRRVGAWTMVVVGMCTWQQNSSG